MKVDIFDPDLDRSLIADKPASPRDSSKLLDLSEEDRITDRVFCELPEILHEGDVTRFQRHQGHSGAALRQTRRSSG